MVYQQNEDDEVSIDQSGIVRTIRHTDSPMASVSVRTMSNLGVPTAKDLADEYLRQTANIFSFPASLQISGDALANNTTEQLAFKEEKPGLDTVTVSYAQMDGEIPIWDSGFSVRLKRFPLEVIGAQNEVDYNVNIATHPTSGDLPDKIDNRRLQALLGLSDPNLPMITRKSLIVYRYKTSERTSDNHGGWPDASAITLPLPPVSNNISENQCYVCTDVLFTQPWAEYAAMNWRAFIEPMTGTVLYLRALTSGAAQGCVFLKDPVTKSGLQISSMATSTILDAERDSINLRGLTLPNGGVQSLKGKFVSLINHLQPTTTNPYQFLYQVKTSEFAAVNAYHHCEGLFQFVEEFGFNTSLYFDGTRFPVPVDHYGMGGQVNAQAPGNPLSNGSGGFLFGLANAGGPVGISTDPRVIWHEFGHALLWDHVSSPNFGFAHSAGDTLGAILFDPESRSPDRFETFPYMNLSANLSRRHDRDVRAGWCWQGGQYDDTQYGSEQILSTTMFRIYRACGGDDDQVSIKTAASRYVIFLILKAIDQLTMRSRNPEVFVDALIDADKTTRSFENFPGGLLHKVIRWSFEKQGLYQPAGTLQPAQPGLPPAVDVFINDGRNGEYMDYLADGGQALDIWNRHQGDGGSANEDPVVGLANYLYVKVSNRGLRPANQVVVSGFQSNSPSSMWPNDWKPITTTRISINNAIAVGTPEVVGPFEWTPIQQGSSVLFTVDATGDRCNSNTVTVAADAKLMTLLDNNIGMRTF